MRGKRNGQGNRPWSVSCLSQLTHGAARTPKSSSSGNTLNTPTNAYERTSGMSISESALNTLAMTPQNMRACSTTEDNSKYNGSMNSVKTTVPGNVSSSTTINEGFVNGDNKLGSAKRKRLKMKRRQFGGLSCDLETAQASDALKKGHKLAKSCSFSGRTEMLNKELKQERCTASDPSTSSMNKHRFVTLP
jgi:hypothetical protein